MRPVVHVAEGRFINLRILIQPPVVHIQHQFLVDFDVIPNLNNQRTIQSTRYLFPGRCVSVVPIGSSIFERRGVDLLPTRWNRILRQPRNTIHRVNVPDSVPVNCAGYRQLVPKAHLQQVTLPGF